MGKPYGPTYIVDPSYFENSPNVTVIDGIPYRKRRGKLVPIPLKWFGHTTHPQTIRKRKEEAKLKRKERQ